MAAGLDMLNRPMVSASLRIQRTKEKRVTRGEGGRATHGKIEEKTGDEVSFMIGLFTTQMRVADTVKAPDARSRVCVLARGLHLHGFECVAHRVLGNCGSVRPVGIPQSLTFAEFKADQNLSDTINTSWM